MNGGQMALRNALDRLRNVTTTQSNPVSQKSQGNQPNTRVNGSIPSSITPPTASGVFSLGVDVSEKDVFDFSDDEFLQDGIMDTFFTHAPSIIHSSEAPHMHTGPCSSEGNLGSAGDGGAHTGTCSGIHGGEGNLNIAKEESRTNLPSGIQPKIFGESSNVGMNTGMTHPLGHHTNPKKSPTTPSVAKPTHSPRVCSSSPSSLEKLKSFRFVKTLNMNGTVKPDMESDVIPPAKRRYVSNDVTSTNSESASPSSSLPVPSDELPRDVPLPINLELDFDEVLEDVEDYGTCHTSVSTPSVPSPLPFKQPSCNPRRSRIMNTPLTGTLKYTPSTPSSTDVTINRNTGYSSASHLRDRLTPNRTSTSEFRTPQRAAITTTSSTSSSMFATPKNRTTTLINRGTSSTSHSLAPSTPTPTSTSEFRTPQRAPITNTPSISSTSGGMFTTPKNRPLSSITTPSSSFRTPSFAQFPARRKFPGPAGFLPVLAPGQSLDGITVPHPSTPAPASTPRIQRLTAAPPDCSQGSSDPQDFTQGPWAEMMEDLDMKDVNSSALLVHNISKAVKLSSRQRLLKGKVTHLRVMLKSIVPAGKNATAVLKDPTGEMLCMLDGKVLEEYQKELQPGAVLILRQVSVFSPTPGKHYLSITADNIVRIYSLHPISSPRRPLLLSERENDTNGKDTQLLRDSTSQQTSQDTSVFSSCKHTLPNKNLLIEKHRDSRSSCPDTMIQSGNYIQCNPSGNSGNDLLKDTPQDQDWDNRNEDLQMQQSSVFSKQLCEDEFDDLFSSFDDSSLDF